MRLALHFQNDLADNACGNGHLGWHGRRASFHRSILSDSNGLEAHPKFSRGLSREVRKSIPRSPSAKQMLIASSRPPKVDAAPQALKGKRASEKLIIKTV